METPATAVTETAAAAAAWCVVCGVWSEERGARSEE